MRILSDSWCVLALTMALVSPRALLSQTHGVIRGVVTGSGGSTLRGVSVAIAERTLSAPTNVSGEYVLLRVPAGEWTLVVNHVGYRASRQSVTVVAGQTTRVDLVLESQPVVLGELMVVGVSRAPEPIIHAPAAVASVPQERAQAFAPIGQIPGVLATMPGVDVVQSGVSDFNLNTRGFNSSLNRRVLVLQDGRDLSTATLGTQEWNALSIPLDDFESVEMLRGPSSALYGANAYSGVLWLTTPEARKVVGTKLMLAGGSLATRRADLRHARTFASGRAGLRLNVGFSRSESWTRSRTASGDLSREYAGAIDTVAHPVRAPSPGFELRPLEGQASAGPGQPATGVPDPVRNTYGSARFDLYEVASGVLTTEAGAAQGENETVVTGIGRVQILKSLRPWARIAWNNDRLSVFASWSARQEREPQRSLASGGAIDEQSSIAHLESQLRLPFGGTRGRIIVGGAIRRHHSDSRLTLLDAADDRRSDWYQSAYAQGEYQARDWLRFITAARYDRGDLLEGIISPKAAVVVTPDSHSSFRFTFNRAFQTPNILERFIRVPAGAPANFTNLENALRASPLGPALANVPVGALFTVSSSVPVLALGNRNVQVEHITSYELGWKGQFGSRFFVTVDAFHSNLRDFVTDLLPGVNPAYAPWTAPPEVPAGSRGAVEGAVNGALTNAGQTTAARGLTRLPADSSTAIVVSIANAGRANEQGVEVGAGLRVADGLLLEVSYTRFNFEVDSASLGVGDQVLPNAPRQRFSMTLTWSGAPRGIQAEMSARFAEGFDWAAGAFAGRVPSSQLVDASVGYQINTRLRVHTLVTNLFDQQRYQLFGGSIIGRRVVAGLTATL